MCDVSDHYFLKAKVFFPVPYNNQKFSINSQDQTQDLRGEKYYLDNIQHEIICIKVDTQKK